MVFPLLSDWDGFGGSRRGRDPEGVRLLQIPCRLGQPALTGASGNKTYRLAHVLHDASSPFSG